MVEEVRTHPTAEVSNTAKIGKGTKIWHQVHIREDSEIGEDCTLGKNVYVDFGVKIGNKVKIQNNSCIYHGSSLEDGVFIGSGVILTNDKYPRAITPTGELKKDDDWIVGKTLVKYGASIGSGSIVLPGITIGKHAMVGAGSVVTKDVPNYGLVYGNPAKLHGYVCKCGEKLDETKKCPKCKKTRI